MVEQSVPSKVYITEEEHVKLLYAAEARQALLVGFGANRVWIEENPLNEWAFTLLAQWRGITK